jgi:hypothetical protein
VTRYFAYGANLDHRHMGERCPGAAVLGQAVLPGREFRIAATGYGDAAPVAAPDRLLYGLLWELGPRDEAALDAFEGVPEGLYRKEYTTVRAEDGGEVAVMLYRAANPAPGIPVPGYLEGIIAAAESLGFPVDYVRGLKAQLIAMPNR